MFSDSEERFTEKIISASFEASKLLGASVIVECYFLIGFGSKPITSIPISAKSLAKQLPASPRPRIAITKPLTLSMELLIISIFCLSPIKKNYL